MTKKKFLPIIIYSLILLFAAAVSAQTVITENLDDFSSYVSELVKDHTPDTIFRDAYIDAYTYKDGEPLSTLESFSDALCISLSTDKLTVNSTDFSSERIIFNGNRLYITDKTGVKPISGVSIQNGVALVPVVKAAEALGYTVGKTDNGAVITRPFQSARLIVSTDIIDDTYGATDIISNGKGIFILQYNTEAEAIYAFNILSAIDGMNVEPDIILQAFDYNSWGYGDSYISMSGYNTWLDSVTDNLPEVIVAVIDSGVNYSHKYLSDRIITDRDKDYVNNDNDAIDDNGHGTHVAGIIADGTLPNVKILPLKVISMFNTIAASNIVNAINYAVEQKVDVINLSLGGANVNFYESNIIENAINAAVAEGIVVCVAAGNDNINVNVVTPANVESVITVASVNDNKAKASTSNFGTLVDIAAPGENINSCNYQNNDGYVEMSGTSMATPHVSAAAAMLKSYNNSWNSKDIETILNAHALHLNNSTIGSGLLCMNGITNNNSLKLILHESKIDLYPSQSHIINYTTSLNDPSITFTSDNTNVATVENGIVTGIGEGSCNITVTVDGMSRLCVVNVKHIELSLDTDTVSLYIGQSYTPAVTINSELDLTYDITPDDIVSLNSDTITALKAGNATLTVTAAKGLAGEVEKSISVTVKNFGDWYSDTSETLTIISADELYEMSMLLKLGKENFKNKSVTLAADINLSAYPNMISLGSERYPFEGIFDGAGHSVSFLKCTSGDISGMFGEIMGAVIKNLNITGADINGGDLAAVLCAYADDSIIINCAVSGNVTSEYGIAGGICGSCRGTYIINCINSSEINGTLYDGGICGYIENAQTDTSLSYIIDPSFVSRIENCVSTGLTDNAVAGYTGDTIISNCMYLDTSSTSAYEFSSGASRIETSAFNSSCVVLDGLSVNKADAKLNAYILKYGEFAEIPICTWNIIDGMPALYQNNYNINEPFLAVIDNTAVTAGIKKSACVLYNGEEKLTYSVANSSIVSVDEEGDIIGNISGETILTVSCGELSAACKIIVYPTVDWYDGNDTYSLCDASDIVEFASLVNNGVDNFSGATVELSCDIDLSEIENYTVIGDYTSGYGFCGYFDGAGHTVSGLNISNDAYLTGFFGKLGDGGQITNLHIENVSITIGASENNNAVGAIAAVVSRGASVTNCSANGTITTSSGTTAAGISGYNFGNVENCVNYVSITSNTVNDSSVAGIVAVNFNKVSGCINLGRVVSEKGCTGGVVCHNRTTVFINNEATVADCYGETNGSLDISDIINIKLNIEKSTHFDVNFDGVYNNNDILLLLKHQLKA